ncbi:MAG: alcohol dehydrogenase catalytic domain-containing protein [Spirochaetaceae bacterium]|jgi:L-iditol 2-dehydrogenase|nr:alcohol dehydrogenase catalytic domain-containing protein [Spirochaetaceae bacterium]GMO29660.1 MAG: erythritol/L-threitol dehydrogenase [Termitinemataceae bacterium]
MNYPKTMRAVVAYSPTDYRFEKAYPSPECGPDDIIVKVEGCGICAGDLKCKHGAPMFWGDKIQPAWVKAPFIPGHEFLGTIVEMGANVKNWQLGDRVTADQIVPCGECRFCKSGKYWMCQPHDMLGFQGKNNGGMAEYVRYPKTCHIHKVPKNLSLEKALLIEPYACSKHAVDRAEIQCDDIVVISGAGTLGLGMVTYAALKHPKALVSLDMSDERLAKAKEFGATHTFNPSKIDVIAEINKMTDNYGCDTYIEATGHPSSVIQGLSIIRKLGVFVEFSVFGSDTTVDWSIIGDRKELDIRGSHLSPYCFPFVIDGINSGALKTNGVLKTTFKLEEWEKAFDYASGKYGDFKIGLVP